MRKLDVLSMKLYFTRHGESEANTLGIYSNRNSQYPLTPTGRQQARQLAQVLKTEQCTLFFTSPILRALETARIVSELIQLPFTVIDALREYDVGSFEDQPKYAEGGWRHREYLENERRWYQDRQWDSRIEGGESFNDIRARFIPFIEALQEKHGQTEEKILILAHGSLYKAMMPLVFANVAFDFSFTHELDHCEVITGETRGTTLICTHYGRDTNTLFSSPQSPLF